MVAVEIRHLEQATAKRFTALDKQTEHCHCIYFCQESNSALVAVSSKAEESLRFLVEPQAMHLDLVDEQEVALAMVDHRSVKADYMQHQTLAAAVRCR